MKRHALIGIAALSLALGLALAARAADERHSPNAHMDQNPDRYTYDYDDGVCTYHYEYDFKTLKDKFQEKGDCRNVPIQRYRPQASIAPAYPPPAAAPPAIAPSSTATPSQPAPSVTVGTPAPSAERAPEGIVVTPVR